MHQAQLTPTVLAALVGIVPLIIMLLLVLPRRTALLTAFVVGWLLLPQFRVDLPGVLPTYNRGMAICLGILIGLTLVDLGRLMTFRPRWLDLPVAGWCVSPLLASLDNGLGLYDGLAAMVEPVLTFGIPYLVGRIYLSDAAGLRALALAIVVGGLIYVPLCLIEIRLSPQLHNLVYGYHQHSFSQTYRLGGWRPTVFLQHGLAVGMFMAMASLQGGWLLATGGLRRYGAAAGVGLVVLWATTLLCRALGGFALLLGGIASLTLGRALRSGWPVFLLTLVPPTYVATRLSGAWTGEALVQAVATHVDPARAQSIEFRFHNEDLLAERALQRPVFGWGGWGRARLQNDRGQDIVVTDGWWIIALGQRGFVGLACFALCFLLPVWLFLARIPASRWGLPEVAPAAGLAVLVALALIDSLLNAMFNPMWVLAMGGLSGALLPVPRRVGVELPPPIDPPPVAPPLAPEPSPSFSFLRG